MPHSTIVMVNFNKQKSGREKLIPKSHKDGEKRAISGNCGIANCIYFVAL